MNLTAPAGGGPVSQSGRIDAIDVLRGATRPVLQRA